MLGRKVAHVYITERWEYLTIEQIPEEQFDAVKESYAELGYDEVEREAGKLIVRKAFPVVGQILVD